MEKKDDLMALNSSCLGGWSCFVLAIRGVKTWLASSSHKPTPEVEEVKVTVR